MKIISLTVLQILVNACIALAQTDTTLPVNSFQLIPALSLNSTDYVSGFAIAIEYNHYFRKKLSWSVGLTSTVHDGSIPVQYYPPTLVGPSVAKAGRAYYTTSGLQTNFSLGYGILRTPHHNLQVQLGPMIRFQTSSNPDREGLNLSPYVYFEKLQNYRTLSYGGILQLSYSYTFQNNLYVLAQAGLHYDSNDDGFNMFGLGIGKRFRKL
jgi:hypothetical protein